MTSRRFVNALRIVINEHSQESVSNTPDFVLARFLAQSLEAFDLAVTHRDDWNEPKENIDGLKLELAEAADQIAVLKREFEATTGSLSTAQANIRSLREENDTLQAKITRLTGEPTEAMMFD